MPAKRFRALASAYLDKLSPPGSGTRAAIRLGGGTGVGQALVVLSSPLLTRMYTPVQMGQFGLLSSFVGFAAVGLTLRYDMAIVPAKSDLEADRLLVVAIGIAVPMAVLSAALMLILVKRDLLAFGSLPTSAVVVTLALLVATGIFGAARFWAIRRFEFATIARASVAQGAGRALLPLVVGAAGAGWWGLVSGELAGRLFGIGALLRVATPAVRETVKRTSAESFRESALSSWRYPLIVAPSALLDALGTALALPIVAATFGGATAGQLLIVQRLTAIPASLIGASVADVFHAKISVLFHSHPQELRNAVWSTVGRLTLLALAIYLPVAVASRFGFAIVFGADWREAGYLVALFTPLSIATLAIGPVTRLYFVVNRPELKLIFDIGTIAVPIVAFSFMHSRGFGYWYCMATYVALGTMAWLLHFALTLWAAGLPPREQRTRASAA